MNDQYKPARYYKTFGHYDEVKDAVQDTDGKVHIVTMRGWHWNNLDWIKENTPITEAMLVDNAYIGTHEYKDKSLSECLEATIYFFIDAYHKARMERKAKESKGGKEQIGHA